jgi:hypothetical protein
MMTVTRLSQDQLEQVRPLLARSRCKPYRALHLPSSAPVDALWFNELAAALEDGQGAAFVVRDGPTITGLAVGAPQDWETRVLGHKAAVLKHLVVSPEEARRGEVLDLLLREVLAQAQAEGVELLSCRIYTDDGPTLHALQRQKFLLVDTVLDHVYDTRRNPLAAVPRPPLPPGCTLCAATPDDSEPLEFVAENAFRGHFGRFHSDERLPRHVATRVYREWIRSCCNGYADHILVARVDGVVAGYSVWKKPSALEQQFGLRVGHYSIAGVHSDFAGRGLYGALTYAGMAALHETVDWIEGPTHINNYPVQRGYTKLHWRMSGARHTLHRWIPAQATAVLPLKGAAA